MAVKYEDVASNTRIYHLRYTPEQWRIDGIRDIRGVSSAIRGVYDVAVTKGAAFSWDEIHPAVERMLEEFDDAA